MAIEILVVDDETVIIDEILEALAGEDYRCRGAGNVDEALGMLAENTGITLVITDLKMPGKTGADLIREAREKIDRDIAFIIISGHAGPMAEADGANLEDFEILAKPLAIGDLLDAVERRMASSGTEK